MILKEQHIVVKALLAASLVLTVINLSLTIADRFKDEKKCNCKKER